MERFRWLVIGLASVLSGTALAQEPLSDPATGLPAQSRLGRQAAESKPTEPPLGPTPAPDVKLLQDLLESHGCFPREFDCGTGEAKDPPIKIYGWADGGYTYSTSGAGPLSVGPVPNHFGDEFTFNQISITIEKPLDPKELSWGFVVHPYGGSDAALLNPIRGAVVRDPDPRFGFDFRDLYLQAHLPILTEGGVDVLAGQHYPLIGYQSAMAPFRTFYSNDYQWFYGEAGDFTGVVATCHVTKQLDVVNAVSFGYITFFNNLSVAPTCWGRIDYWLQEEKKTQISIGCVTGPASPHSGANTTLTDVTLTQNWNRRLTQVVQCTAGYSQNGLGSQGLERDYGIYNLFIYHATPKLDLNSRVEWYDDVDGRGYPGGTGFKNNYEEVTLGVDYHPIKYLQIRPELRADFANDTPAFGPVAGPKSRSQFTPAIDCLFKF